MRYSKDHKAETHARIVRAAAVLLREKGVHGVGVAELMKEAGLTHGGFYAHFASRDALLHEALVAAMERSISHWRKEAETTPPRATVPRRGRFQEFRSRTHRCRRHAPAARRRPSTPAL